MGDKVQHWLLNDIHIDEVNTSVVYRIPKATHQNATRISLEMVFQTEQKKCTTDQDIFAAQNFCQCDKQLTLILEI